MGKYDIIKHEIDKLTTKKVEDLTIDEDFEIFEKKKILVRNIVDYIAGMTDSYAINESERIK